MTNNLLISRRFKILLIVAVIVAVVISCLLITSSIAKSVLPPLPKSIAQIARMTNNFESLEAVEKAGEEIMGMLDTIEVVGDQVLNKTAEGRRYIDIAIQYESEITEVVKRAEEDPELLDNMIVTVIIFGPSMQALVDGQGDTVVVTPEMVAQVNWILDYLEQYGSPELREVIRSERESKPFEPLVGMNFNEACLYLIGPVELSP
jgi:flagellar basal body-associated protein FliL